MAIRTRAQLREIADENGVIIRKGRKTTAGGAVKIYEDGTILRCDSNLQLDQLIPMTVKDAVKFLEL